MSRSVQLFIVLKPSFDAKSVAVTRCETCNVLNGYIICVLWVFEYSKENNEFCDVPRSNKNQRMNLKKKRKLMLMVKKPKKM